MIPEPEYDDAYWMGVLKLAVESDRRGSPLTVVDLMIAEAARRLGATLITRDGDFHRIPGLSVARELPRR